HLQDWRRTENETNAVNLPRLLCPDDERSSQDALTYYGDERSPVHHWMIWSARTSRDCGIVSPRAFAVLRLITSSNFVGSSMGISAGWAPFKILSTCVAA